jgi:hypothetical protein
MFNFCLLLKVTDPPVSLAFEAGDTFDRARHKRHPLSPASPKVLTVTFPGLIQDNVLLERMEVWCVPDTGKSAEHADSEESKQVAAVSQPSSSSSSPPPLPRRPPPPPPLGEPPARPLPGHAVMQQPPRQVAAVSPQAHPARAGPASKGFWDSCRPL